MPPALDGTSPGLTDPAGRLGTRGTGICGTAARTGDLEPKERRRHCCAPLALRAGEVRAGFTHSITRCPITVVSVRQAQAPARQQSDASLSADAVTRKVRQTGLCPWLLALGTYAASAACGVRRRRQSTTMRKVISPKVFCRIIPKTGGTLVRASESCSLTGVAGWKSQAAGM